MTAQALRIKSARSRGEIRRWRHLGFRGGVATALGKIRVELAQDVGRGVLRAVVDTARTVRRGHCEVNFVLQSLEGSLADLAIHQAPRVEGRALATCAVTKCAVRSVFRCTRREVRRWRHFGFRESVAAALGKIRVEGAQDVGRGVSRAVVNVAAGARVGCGHGGVNPELQFVETLSAGLAPQQ